MRTGAHTGQPISPDGIAASGLCIGCGTCVAQSSDPGASMSWDRYGQLKPDRGLALPASVFDRICPFAPGARDEDELASTLFPKTRYVDRAVGRFNAAYVGHVEEGNFRAKGSSGGMVTWVAAELLQRGLVDGIVHVAAVSEPGAAGRFFRYTISRSVAEVRSGACSRYYPVDLSDVLRAIRATPGRYAFVGIPCFIKAVNLLRAEDEIFRQRIVYTLGLFCGHMKSARFVESIAWQVGVDPAEVTGVEYRIKDPRRPANWYRARLTLADGSIHEKDWWHLADGDWGAGFFQNSACNYCDDVVAETADIAFGDAWVEPYSRDGHGTNVVIVRKPELSQIISAACREGRILLNPVDARFIRDTQAAGIRQRREGLAYRLVWKPPGVDLKKRTPSQIHHLSARRKLVYRSRYLISRWSHEVFAIARRSELPAIYVWWAKTALSLYQGFTYSRGAVGRVCDTLLKSRL